MPEFGLLDKTHKLIEKFARLYEDKSFSDVTFVIGQTKFFAHRFVLAAHSKFFEILLFGPNYKEPRLDAMTIDAPVEAFRELLRFMYTGALDLRKLQIKVVLELFELCHRYDIGKDIEEDIMEYLCIAIDPPNAVKALEISRFIEIKRLEILAWNLIEMTIQGVFDVELGLNYDILAELVLVRKRRISEEKLYKVIIEMIDIPDFCSDEQAIELLSSIKPEKMIPFDPLTDVVPQGSNYQSTAKVIVQKGGENLFSSEDDFTAFGIEENQKKKKNYILIILDQVYTFNYMKLNLLNITDACYSVKSSKTGHTWEKIVDFSKTPCDLVQNLYFDLKRAKYIKIYGTETLDDEEQVDFSCNSFEIAYVENPPKFLSVYVIPTHNVAVQELASSNWGSDAILNGNFQDLGINTPYKSIKLPYGSMVILFNQPYILSSCKFRLWDYDGRKYSYILKVIGFNKCESVVNDKSDEWCDGWQKVTFAPRIVSFFRIDKIVATKGDDFRLAYFEAPSQSN